MTDTTPNRCRLVLIAQANDLTAMSPARVLGALEGGDVASLILVGEGVDDVSFQDYCEAITRPAQERGVAVVVAGDTRIAGRVGADGIHVEAGRDAVEEMVRRQNGRMMVGAGGAKTRHDAMELGEAQPDYMFFGRFGYDNKPEPHPRNVDLAEWWSSMMEIPCIVLGGSSLEGVAAAAATGAEFLALSSAVFAGEGQPADAVREANRLLDRHSPVFDDV